MEAKEYWLVDLEKKEIEVMGLGESGLETVKIYKRTDILESLVLKGIKIKLDEIF